MIKMHLPSLAAIIMSMASIIMDDDDDDFSGQTTKCIINAGKEPR